MTQHAPGPWAISPIFAELGLTMNDGSIPVMAGDDRVCVVDYRGNASTRKRYNAPSAERDANARLIATAPDLLAALTIAHEWLANAQADEPEDFTNPRLDEAVALIVAAIAKATGQG